MRCRNLAKVLAVFIVLLLVVPYIVLATPQQEKKCKYVLLIGRKVVELSPYWTPYYIKTIFVNASYVMLVMGTASANWFNLTSFEIIDYDKIDLYIETEKETENRTRVEIRADAIFPSFTKYNYSRFSIIEYINTTEFCKYYTTLGDAEMQTQVNPDYKDWFYYEYMWCSDEEKNYIYQWISYDDTSHDCAGILSPAGAEDTLPFSLIVYEVDDNLRVIPKYIIYFVGLCEGKFRIVKVLEKPPYTYKTYILALFDSRFHIRRKSWMMVFTRELFEVLNASTIYIDSMNATDYLLYTVEKSWTVNATTYKIVNYFYPNSTVLKVWYCNETSINQTTISVAVDLKPPENLLWINITDVLIHSSYFEYLNETSKEPVAYIPSKNLLVIFHPNYIENEGFRYTVARLEYTGNNTSRAVFIGDYFLPDTIGSTIRKIFAYGDKVVVVVDRPDLDRGGGYIHILDFSTIPPNITTSTHSIGDVEVLDSEKMVATIVIDPFTFAVGYLYFNGTVRELARIPSTSALDDYVTPVINPSKTLSNIIGSPTFIISKDAVGNALFFIPQENTVYIGVFVNEFGSGPVHTIVPIPSTGNYTVIRGSKYLVLSQPIAFDPQTGEPRIRIWGTIKTVDEIFELPYILLPKTENYYFYFFRVKLTVNTLYVPTSRVDYVRDVALYKLRLGLLYKRGDVSVDKVVHWVYIRTGGVDVDYSVDYVDDATIRLSFKTVLHPPLLAGEQFGGVKVKIRELPIDVPLTEYEKLYLEQAFDIHFVKDPKAYASPELVTTFGGLAVLLALAMKCPAVGLPLAIIYCLVGVADVWIGGTHAKVYPCFIRANIVRIQIGDREVKWAVPIVPDTKGGEYAVKVLERLFPNVIIHRPIKVGRNLQEYLHAIRKGVVTHLDVKTMIIEDIAKYGDVTKAVIKGVETYLIFAVTGEPAVIGWTYNLVSEFDMHIRGMYFRIAGLLPPEKIKDIGGEIKDPKAILSTLPYIVVSGYRVNGSITPSGVVYQIALSEGVDSLVITPPDLTNKYLVKGTLEADGCIKCPFIITDWGGFLRFHYTTPIEFKIKMIELVDLPFRIRSIVRELPFIAPEYLVDAMKKANVREMYNNATNTYTYVITGLDVKWMDPYNSMSAHYCKWFNYTIISTEPPNAWIRVYIEGFKVMTIPQEAHVVIGTNVENDIDYGVALLLFEYTGTYKPEEVVAEVPKEVKEVLGSRLLKYLALGKLITAVVLDKGTIHLPENGNWTKSYPIQKYIVEALARATVTGKVLVVVAGKISATKDYYWSDNFDYADTIVTAVTNITKSKLVVPIKVVDVDTDEPIQGATVKIFKKVGASEELVAEGTTNASGMVTLYVPCAGTYKLYAEHPDYKPNYIITQIYYNATVPYVIKLARKEYQQWVPPPPPVAGEYGAEEGYPPIITPEGKKMYWLLIHVVTKDGFPVSGATVKIYNATEQLYDTEVTNGTGTAYFLVPEGFSGTYEVYYNELYVNGTIAPVYKHRVIEVVLPIYSKQNKTGHVVFYVYDVVSRTPIEGAKLEIKEPYYNRLVAVVYTNATGYAEKWLPYGAYNLTVYAGGYYNYSIQFYVLSTEQVIRIPLLPLTGVTQYVPPYPPANDSRPPVIINGTEYYYLWVRVSYEDGAPVHGANVTVYDAVRYSDITNGTGTVYFLLPAYKVYYVNVTYLNYTAVRSLNLTHHTFLVFKVPYKSVYFQPEVLIKSVDLVFVRGIAPAYHLVLVTILTNVPQTVVVEVNVTRVDTGELIKSYNVTFVCDEAGVYTNATFVYINVTGQNVPFRVCAKIVQFEYDTNLGNNFMCSAVRRISSKRAVEVFVLWKVIDFGNKYRYILPELTKVQVCIKVKTTFNLTTYKLHVKPVIEYMDYIKKRRERIEKLAVITTENPSGAVMWFNYTFVIPWTDVINLTAFVEKLPIPVDEIKIFNASIRVDPNARLERVDLPKTVTSEQEFTYKIVVKSNVYDPQASATVVFIDADTGEVVYSWSSRVELKKGLNTIVVKAKAPRVEPKKIFGFEVAPTVKKFIVNATVNGYNVYPEDDTLTTTVYVSSKIPLLTWAFIGALALIILLLILVMVSLLARKTVTIRRTRYL